MSKVKKIATHNGSFHADDVFGVSVLLGIYPEADLIRTRNASLIDGCDFAVDVGGRWEDATGRFDHHQAGFNGKRNSYVKDGQVFDGIGYASAGLVWRVFGEMYVRMVGEENNCELTADECKKIASSVDDAFVRYIDMVDNGEGNAASGAFGFSSLIAMLNSTWMEEVGLDMKAKEDIYFEKFLEATSLTTTMLKKLIMRSIGKIKAESIVRTSERLFEGKVLFLKEGGMPWTKVVLEEMPDVVLVIYSDSNGDFLVHTVPVELGSFESKVSLPKDWAGLRNVALSKVNGVEDSVFCHLNLFICGATSIQGALRMADIALQCAKSELNK